MPQNYVPIFIFIAIISIALPLPLLAAKLVRPENPSKTKLMPYECGIDPVGSARFASDPGPYELNQIGGEVAVAVGGKTLTGSFRGPR